MSEPTPPYVEVRHTVAVYLPGTPARVHVTELDGPPEEACATATQIVRQLAQSPALWHAKAVDTHEVETVPDQLHDHL